MHTGLFVFLFTFFYLSFSFTRSPVNGRRLLSPYIPRHELPAVSFLPAALMASAHTVKAYVVPEEWKRADWTEPCTDSDSPTLTAEVTIADATVTPVTVTVTVFASQASSSHSTTTGALTGDGNVNGTVAYSSRTSTSAVPTATVNSTVSSAQRAQQLNAEFSTLTLDASCTPGQLACIGTKLAQCSTPITSDETPKWVSQTCVFQDSNSATICAAVPSNNTTTSTSTLSSNSSAPVELGCFVPSDITQRFTSAGVSGGMYPPGFQTTSGASGRITTVDMRMGVAGVFALIAGLLAL